MGLNMEGLVTADTRFDFRLSHLSSQNFHHMKIDGNMSVKRFHAERVDSSITLFASGARLHFGTSSKASLPTATVDSLLTVSISTDTIAARMDSGMVILAATSLKAGIGTRATSSSLDTTKVLPVGGRFSAGRLYFRSIPDSMVTRLNDVVAHASITRYKGNARVPRMQLRLDAGRVRYSDPFNRASVADGHFDLSVHLREADSTARARRIARRDSLLRSGVDIDSLVKARRALAGRRGSSRLSSRGGGSRPEAECRPVGHRLAASPQSPWIARRRAWTGDEPLLPSRGPHLGHRNAVYHRQHHHR